MLIDQLIETPEGTIQFKGELDKKELEMVISVGLNYLLQQGVLPFTMVDNDLLDEADESNSQ